MQVCDWERKRDGKRPLTCGVKGGQKGRELVGAREDSQFCFIGGVFLLTGYEILTVQKFNSYLINDSWPEDEELIQDSPPSFHTRIIFTKGPKRSDQICAFSRLRLDEGKGGRP
jgi:hypothetical protein